MKTHHCKNEKLRSVRVTIETPTHALLCLYLRQYEMTYDGTAEHVHGSHGKDKALRSPHCRTG